jgi:hypothetical protein
MAGEFTQGGSSEYERAAEAISARLGGIASSGFTGPGRFAYSPDQLREIIKEWNDIAESYRVDIQDADVVKSVQPPGQDGPSSFFATVVQNSGDALQQSLTKEQDLCMRQAEKFQAALDTYLGVEHTTKNDFDKQDPGTVL